jgi:SAM-dependent methyltransferase
LQDRLGHVPGRWAFWRCRECGSAVLSPFPKANELASFYPPVYSFTLDLGRESPFRRFLARLEYLFYFQPQYEAQARRVLRGIDWQGVRGQRLLDVGCGRGLRLLTFRRRGFDVQGMDLQPEVVEYLRKELGIPAVCTDVQGLPECFPPASFDLITAFFVLEHVPSVEAVLESCFRLIKPGGWFVGAVPFVDSVQAGLFKGRWINATEAPRHLSLPTRAGMEHVCRRAGFDKVMLRPDSTLNCAGQVGISLFPGGTITHVYGGGRVRALAGRLLAGSVTMLSIPFCVVENYVLRRPSLGMVFAHKPDKRGPDDNVKIVGRRATGQTGLC